jgi:hypothetical protein
MTDRKTAEKRPTRRRVRVRKARPLLLAIGAAVAIAGCGDDSTTVTNNDMGVPVVRRDMAVPVVHDLGLPPRD